MRDLTGFVLAGGRSSRMGEEKALLRLGGRTLLERALEKAREVAASVHIAGPAERFAAYGEVVEDVYPGRGPLGAIHAALSASRTELNLMLAADMPFVEAEFLRRLAAEAERCGAVVTVPRGGGGLQPLCAVYRRSFAAVAQAALEQGENKIDRLFAPPTTRVVEVGREPGFAFGEGMFDNLNTPEDAARAQARLEG
jgi:molybdopterin-guanine dinucleotide biosynthesis protein A